MSVLVPDLKVYSYIQQGVEKIASNSVIDDFYSHSIQGYFKNCPDITKEAKKLVICWLNLNQWSWDKKYSKEGDKETDLTKFYNPFVNSYNINSVQLLKYIECIDYNIEIEPDEEYFKIRLKLLKDFITELTASIIHNTEEYNDCLWSDEPPVIENKSTSLTSRSNRRQLRLDKAGRRYAKNFKSGKTGVRYL